MPVDVFTIPRLWIEREPEGKSVEIREFQERRGAFIKVSGKRDVDRDADRSVSCAATSDIGSRWPSIRACTRVHATTERGGIIRGPIYLRG